MLKTEISALTNHHKFSGLKESALTISHKGRGLHKKVNTKRPHGTLATWESMMDRI